MLEMNPGLMLWTIITFLCLAVILSKFAWKPILTMLTERENQIRDALAQAASARAEAAELMKQNEQNLARAETKYHEVIREGKALAEKMKEEIVAKARQQAEKELARATDEIQLNLESAKQQLRADIADLAIKAAEIILDETLDEQKQRKLVDKFIDQLPKN